MPIEVRLPPLGDQIESGDVLEVKVREGTVIAKDQGIVELETDKATVEIPSPHAGKVLKVHVRDGQTVKIGASLITLEEADSPAAAAVPPRKPEVPKAALESRAPTRTETPPRDVPKGSQPAVSDGPRPSPTMAAANQPKEPSPRAELPPIPKPSSPVAAPVGISSPEAIAAGPAVRRFAREVGVDLGTVRGTGSGGRITREDVLAAVRQANEVARDRAPSAIPGKSAAPPGDSDSWGPVHYEKITKIRQTIAAKMSESWSTVPRVTNFDDADVTELERIRQSSKNDYAAQGIKLTSLPFVAKAVAMSLKKHPVVNANYDAANERIIYKDYVNLGIAVDTERGLVVPALRNADQLSISQIAREMATIAESVRSGSFSVDDLRGTTFTISNLGAIGGTYSTPIVNIPEVAILLVGRSRKMPVVVNDQVAVRLMMPLSLSYDHRLVDGASAARFLNEVIGYLAAPSRLLLAP